MIVTNLLEFLNVAQTLYVPLYNVRDFDMFNLLELLQKEIQYTQKIDLGLIYLYKKKNGEYIILDGVNRMLSLSLLLHAVCECYKATTPQNEQAIRTIRKKYLLNDTQTKFLLQDNVQNIYQKIIFGERLSDKEKTSKLFKLLHEYWVTVKTEGLQASYIFKLLNKLKVTVVEVDNIPLRDFYYSLNKDKYIDNMLMIEDYLTSMELLDEWIKIKEIFKLNSKDLILFLKDYFVSKFDFKDFKEERLYDIFLNYMDIMVQYSTPADIIKRMRASAILYYNLLNINIEDIEIKDLLIKIKINHGEDTNFYLLNVYEDYIDDNISKNTLIEILQAINEYLQNRQKTADSIPFSELIDYLNAFITCK